MENKDMQKLSIGEFRDVITYANGDVEVTEWSRNTIVTDINKAIAYALAQKGGATYWAIGSGQEAWDTAPVNPQPSDTRLNNEIGRKLIPASAIKFLDAQGNETNSITNTILITLTFGANELNGKWREFAIVGGNATSNTNSGILINHKTHGVINKTDTMEIERQMKFTFN
jgi:hypothetical protein